MSLFDGKGLNPRPTNRRDMINQMSDSVRTNFLDPMMGSLGMESEETTIMNIMKDANLSDPKSVADTFSKIMAINPEAASEFKTQVIPLLEAQQAAVPAANRIKEGTSRKVGAGDNTLKTQTYTNGAWVDAVDAEGEIYTEKQFKPTAPSSFAEKTAYIDALRGQVDPSTNLPYTEETLALMKNTLLDAGGIKIDFGSEDSFNTTVGTILAEKMGKQIDLAEKGPAQIDKLNTVLRVINKGEANVGFASSLKQGFDKAFAAFGSVEAMESAEDTEFLGALLGSDVFPYIQSLGIGARGLDTPAEREFLQQVMTGTLKMEGQALEQLTRLRQKYTVRAIQEYNRRLTEQDSNGNTYYKRWEDSTGFKLDVMEIPKMVRPNKESYKVSDGQGGTVSKVFPTVRPILNDDGESTGAMVYQYRPNGPMYDEQGIDITKQFPDQQVTYVGSN